MADETMFARLCRAAWDTAEQRRFPDVTERWMTFESGNAAEVANTKAIVRALLTELRTMAVELPDGFVTVASITAAPKVNIAATEQTVVKAGAVGFIDAILAEAKP